MSQQYFISYKHKFGIGHLCYTGVMTKTWLVDRLFDKELVVLFISSFTDKGKKCLVAYMKNGVYKNKLFNFTISNIEDLDKVWVSFNPADNEIHILSFKNIENEYEE